MKAIILISLLLMSAVPALAIDGSVSVEGDVSRRHVSPDVNLDVGQAFKDFRVHGSAEFCKQYDEFSSSPNYRLGLQYNGIRSVQFEAGAAYYNGAPYGYGRATYSFDTANH